MQQSEQQEPESAIGLMASTGLFDVLDEAALKAVESVLERVHVPGGEILFRQGDPGDSLYVLVYGRLMVTVQDTDGKEEVIGEVGRGEVVGEMAIMTGETRSATVRAMRDSDLVRFTQDAYERVILANPLAVMMIAKSW